MLRNSMMLIICLVGTVGVTASEPTASINQPDNAENAILYGINTLPDVLEIKVRSFGCTKTSHFELDYNHIKRGVANMSVVRLKPDRCKNNPVIKTIQLKIDPIVRTRASQLVITNTFKTLSSGI